MGNELYSPQTLASKSEEAAKEAKNALVMSIIGLFCFGFIFGYLAYRKANAAIQTIDTYQVALDKRGVATAAKVLGLLDIVFWIGGLMLRFVVG
jgi:hypothetical protein